ncbi:MAG: aminotransferase class III-fold pyridoxal phosphate-dependent enzyme [Alphaproteobacteria bacterium]
MSHSGRYKKSEEMLARAEKVIPLGTQTFSKSRTQFPYGVSPYFIERGDGALVYDVDGNEYIDFINALGAVTLGYNDPDVKKAVLEQMEQGTIFSLAHPAEVAVAEKMVEMIPCAEKVRYGKNGSDATAGAVRLARAFTGREHVLVGGYHGWQDWYIGSTARNLGVPKAVCALTHSFAYNDLEVLEARLNEHQGEVACVILEPMSVFFPDDDYLKGVKELTHKHGALLIFDETVTGFRIAKGGAQEYFGVVPDLATFGKGMANGYPLSAIVGRADIMDVMEDIFFSFTYGGETLSLVAALATMTKLQNEPVLETLAKNGARFQAGVNMRIKELGLDGYLNITGHPAWSFLHIKDHEKFNNFTIRTFLMQEMMKNGILTLGTHLMSYAQSDEHIDRLIATYADFLARLKTGLEEGSLRDMLDCEPLEPLFKVRQA